MLSRNAHWESNAALTTEQATQNEHIREIP
jgi:hypothetical protein